MYSVEVIPDQRTERLPSAAESMDSVHPSNLSVSRPAFSQAYGRTHAVCVRVCVHVHTYVSTV